MASEPIPTALVAFRVPSEPCLTGRGKSAGLLPEPLRCTSDANMDLVPACTDSDGDANLIGVLVLAQTGLQRNKIGRGLQLLPQLVVCTLYLHTLVWAYVNVHLTLSD